MNPYWLHDQTSRHRMADDEPLPQSANDHSTDNKTRHRAGFWMRARTRLHWSPADWQGAALVVIVYGGLAGLWGAKQAGLFDLLVKMFFADSP